MKKTLLPVFLLLTAFALPPHPTKLWLIGDSTMSNKEVKAYPETGWGMPFTAFFDSTVVVDNRAKNGRSTKSFRAEGLWQPVLDHMQEGDYVLIQFGHNDEGKEKVGRYTTPEEFKANLLQYVQETRAKKAIPILITPVARRTFDNQGTIKESHPVYADAVREVARTNNVPLIDLDKTSMAMLQQLGPDNSQYFFNYLEPGEHPNYPEGRKDDTHFNELGARKIAELVLNGLKELNLGINSHVVVPIKKS